MSKCWSLSLSALAVVLSSAALYRTALVGTEVAHLGDQLGEQRLRVDMHDAAIRQHADPASMAHARSIEGEQVYPGSDVKPEMKPSEVALSEPTSPQTTLRGFEQVQNVGASMAVETEPFYQQTMPTAVNIGESIDVDHP